MKVNIQREALRKPLYRAEGVVERKNPSNVLSGVRIEATESGLTFFATDYDVTLTAETIADVIEPGTALINGRTLYDVVRALPEEASVTLTVDAKFRAHISAGRSAYTLNGLDPAEFPNVVDTAAGPSFLMDKSDLESMLRRTLFSVAQDESRPALNGILLQIEPSPSGADDRARVRLVSTDGHRLSKTERDVTAQGYNGQPRSTIVHRRGAAELKRIFEGDDPGVRIEFVGRNVVFSSDKARLQVRQIEETFPEYDRVIPKKADAVLTVSAREFASAIRRVSTIAAIKGHMVRVEIGAGELAVEMEHPDYGHAREVLEVPDYQGRSVAVGFNPQYLLEVLAVINAETERPEGTDGAEAGPRVIVSLSDQFSPCLLRAEDDESSVFVVMPMRL